MPTQLPPTTAAPPTQLPPTTAAPWQLAPITPVPFLVMRGWLKDSIEQAVQPLHHRIEVLEDKVLQLEDEIRELKVDRDSPLDT